MTEDKLDYGEYLGTTQLDTVEIALSPIWIDKAIARGIDVGKIKSRTNREVLLVTNYEQRKTILRNALQDTVESEELLRLKELASYRRAALRVVRKLRAKLMD